MVTVGRFAWIALLWSAVACTTPVRTETLPPALDHAVRRIALAPVATAPLPGEGASGNGSIEKDGADVVAARLMSALGESGRYEMIGPREVHQALETAGLDLASATPASVGQVAQRKFGADAVLFARVRRFERRRGGKRGVFSPASVRFEAELVAPDGARLWWGEYLETQQALTDDPGSFNRARSRGFRWVDAESLAAYGARELVERMPGGE